MNKCPKCGGDTGLEASGRFTQFYSWSGKPDGYEFNGDSTDTAVCCDCGRRFNLTKLEEADAIEKLQAALNEKVGCTNG